MVNTINIDAGGTFTDGYLNWEQQAKSVKVPTTPHDLTECFLECIHKGADKLDVDAETLLAETDAVRLATTLGTNTILERTGPKLGVIVTDGNADDLYGDGVPEDFLIEPDLIRGVKERVTDRGEVDESVDTEEALGHVRDLIDAGARIIVVALSNAAYNPANEQSIRTAVHDRYPQHYLRSVPVHVSTEVTDIPDDRRRSMAAIVNAYIHRQMVRNLYKAEDRVRDLEYGNPLLATHSDGGAARIAKSQAINTYSSGPAAGLIGVRKLTDHYDLESVVATDMGGTSVDAAIARPDERPFEIHPEVAGVEIAVPMLQMTSIGAGGGSIASVEDESLQVGPTSAGARPGPACYDLGGDDPTVTDADVILGHLNPEYFLGGQRQLNVPAARDAIETHVAEPLGLSVENAARRIKDRVDRNIAQDLVSLAGKHDLAPEAIDALFAFGGAGGLHAANYAARVDVDTVLTFPFGSVFNAYGQSTIDVQHAYTHAIGRPLLSVSADDDFETALDALVEDAFRDMRGEGFAADAVSFAVEFVLNAEGGERELVSGTGELTERTATEIANTYAQNTDVAVSQVHLETVRLIASVPVSDLELPARELHDPDPSRAHKTTRAVRWPDETCETPIYDYGQLVPGNRVGGPAVIEATDTTYLVPDPWTYRVDEFENGILQRSR
jgi:N-methylhydantoinase A/acetophenone carboxylase